MALTRVQATGKVFNASSASSLAVPFATPPTLGNAVLVAVTISGSVTSCTDNYGNTYDLVVTRANGSTAAAIYACYAVVATGASFTLTLRSGTSALFVAGAIEVAGGVGGLFVDRSTGATGSSAAPATGATTALRTTSGNAFALAVLAIGTIEASITVESVVPAWTQEYEHLSSTIPGEADSRVLTGVTGTTQSCSWTAASGGSWAAAIAVFASASDLPVIEARETQLATETLSHPTPAARETQLVVETLSHPIPQARETQVVVETLTSTHGVVTEARTTQLLVETVSLPTPDGRVTQLVVEVVGAPVSSAAASSSLTQLVVETISSVTTARATQVVVELVGAPWPFEVRVTQVVAETVTKTPPIPGYLTQTLVELLTTKVAAANQTQTLVELFTTLIAQVRLTQQLLEWRTGGVGRVYQSQQLVEVFYVPGPCIPTADLPVDTVSAGGSCSTADLPTDTVSSGGSCSASLLP